MKRDDGAEDVFYGGITAHPAVPQGCTGIAWRSLTPPQQEGWMADKSSFFNSGGLSSDEDESIKSNFPMRSTTASISANKGRLTATRQGPVRMRIISGRAD